MSGYRLTRRAEKDLFDIFVFGIETFGLAQAQRYGESLTDCFQVLADNPHIGRACPAIGPDLRRHEHGRHVVLYEQAGEDVLIVGVVHSRAVRRLYTG